MAKIKSEDEKLQKAELVMVTAIEKLIEDGKQSLISNTIGTDEYLEELVRTYQNIVVGNIKDISSYNFVCEGEKLLKKLRTSVSNLRLKITSPAENFKKKLIEEEKRIIAILQPLEDNLNKQKVIFEDLTKAEADKAFTERLTNLTENGFQLIGGFYVCGIVHLNTEQIKGFDDENFNFYIEIGKNEVIRQKAETERKEAEALELATAREELAKANKALADGLKELAEAKEELAREKSEIAAQKKALDQTYDKVTENVTEQATAIEETSQGQTDEPPLELADSDLVIDPTVLEAKELEAPKNEVEQIKEAFTVDLGQSATITSDEAEEEAYISPQKIGFEDFREKLLIKLRNPDKFTRDTLIEWVVNLEM